MPQINDDKSLVKSNSRPLLHSVVASRTHHRNRRDRTDAFHPCSSIMLHQAITNTHTKTPQSTLRVFKAGNGLTPRGRASQATNPRSSKGGSS